MFLQERSPNFKKIFSLIPRDGFIYIFTRLVVNIFLKFVCFKAKKLVFLLY